MIYALEKSDGSVAILRLIPSGAVRDGVTYKTDSGNANAATGRFTLYVSSDAGTEIVVGNCVDGEWTADAPWVLTFPDVNGEIEKLQGSEDKLASAAKSVPVQYTQYTRIKQRDIPQDRSRRNDWRFVDGKMRIAKRKD